jgi:hypothetical protein
VGVSAWAAILVATVALALPPICSLITLLLLAALFESVFSLHVAVERIGRYLFVFHDDGWERAAAAFAAAKNVKGFVAVDPLFTVPFALAALVNLMPLLVSRPTMPEVVVVGAAHATFALRLLKARTGARQQRAVDAERFREIKQGS